MTQSNLSESNMKQERICTIYQIKNDCVFSISESPDLYKKLFDAAYGSECLVMSGKFAGNIVRFPGMMLAREEALVN